MCEFQKLYINFYRTSHEQKRRASKLTAQALVNNIQAKVEMALQARNNPPSLADEAPLDEDIESKFILLNPSNSILILMYISL